MNNGKLHAITTRLPLPLIRELRSGAKGEGRKLEEYIRLLLIAGRDALRKKGEA